MTVTDSQQKPIPGRVAARTGAVKAGQPSRGWGRAGPLPRVTREGGLCLLSCCMTYPAQYMHRTVMASGPRQAPA